MKCLWNRLRAPETTFPMMDSEIRVQKVCEFTKQTINDALQSDWPSERVDKLVEFTLFFGFFSHRTIQANQNPESHVRTFSPLIG